MTWDPETYLTYADERGRPFLDLVGRVDAQAPGTVVDLGCGPGNLTVLLGRRWPQARVLGVDSSEAMISRAQAEHPEETWRQQDLRDYLAVPERVDVLVSNATLQWVDGHLDLLPDLVSAVVPGGWLAFQVPGNFEEPSHTLRRELAANPPYAEHVATAEHPASHDAAVYLARLRALGCEVDAWETTYLHVLDATADPDPVFTWVAATGARPTLEALPDDLRPGFVAEFKAALRAAYPVTDGAVVLPFRRVFVVARTSR